MSEETQTEFDARVDAHKPAGLSHSAWRASAARSEVALREWAKEVGKVYGKYVSELVAKESPPHET